MAIQVDDYLALRARLDVPPVFVLGDDEVIERLHPHRPRPDPEWPAPDALRPGVSKRLSDLMWRLSPSVRVVCAITAVEMVLPIWEAWTQLRERPVPHAGAPRRAVEQINRGRGAEFTWDDKLYDALVAACSLASEEAAFAAAAAARSASNAYRTANSKVFSFRGKSAFSDDALAAAAVDDACCAYDEYHAQHTGRTSDLITLRNAWFTTWWDRCRCRLAFEGVRTVVLQ